MSHRILSMTHLLLLSGKNFGGLVYFDGFSVFTLSCLLQFCYGKKTKNAVFRGDFS